MQTYERLLLASAIEHIRSIAKEGFNDNIRDNITEIFKKLSEEERLVILKEFVNIAFVLDISVLTETNNNVNSIKDQVTKSSLDLKEEIDKVEEEVEKFNRKEMIALKTWLAKALFIVLIFGLFVVIFIVSLTTEKEMGEILGNSVGSIFSLIKVIIGM